MERYNRCKPYEKAAIDRMYVYLGFNEVVSFDEYLELMFLNAKENITFNEIFNHTIKHIVTSFWEEYPEYKQSKYIKVFWLNPADIEKYTTVGEKLELDPKGVVRLFVKNRFYKLLSTKL